MIEVGEYLQGVRATRGLTVREMAVMADVDQAQMSHWLNGASISPRNVRRLMDAGLLSRADAVEATYGVGAS